MLLKDTPLWSETRHNRGLLSWLPPEACPDWRSFPISNEGPVREFSRGWALFYIPCFSFSDRMQNDGFLSLGSFSLASVGLPLWSGKQTPLCVPASRPEVRERRRASPNKQQGPHPGRISGAGAFCVFTVFYGAAYSKG